MKIGFIPITKSDWRLLLNLVKEIRLANNGSISYVVRVLKEIREESK